MGVQPPTGDDLTEPDSTEFGIAALDGILASAELSFPADRVEVVRAIGDREIAYDASGHTVQLAKALERIDRERFDSEQALKNELYPVFEDLRDSTATGFIGQLRELVPF